MVAGDVFAEQGAGQAPAVQQRVAHGRAFPYSPPPKPPPPLAAYAASLA
ncbi:MAG: hypothetical protein LBK42_11590 [Propionibacteriaceae bacterium]|nr:hypothetical protein [Propionibacteriaceae bacterium]